MASDTSGKILTAIGAVLQQDPEIRLEAIVVFLHVCEYDGISIKDLIFLSGFSESMVSRSVDALRSPDNGALVRVEQHPSDGRRRLVFLAENGLGLRQRLEEIFAEDRCDPVLRRPAAVDDSPVAG